MSEVFRRSTQLLQRDGWQPIRLTVAGAALLALAWVAWFFGARLPVYVSSRTARVEVSSAAHAIAAPAAGEVRAVKVQLGQTVRAGDPILELDTELPSLRERERAMAAESNRAVIVQLSRQLETEEISLTETKLASNAANAEASKRLSESEEQARIAEEEGRRADELFRRGLMSAAERSRLVSEASRRRITAEALRDAASRAIAESRIAYTAKETEIARLRANLAAGERDLNSALIARRSLAREVATRTVRAPITGRVAEDVNLRPGSVVRFGDHITSIIPAGRLIVVGEFVAASAIGRIHPGLPARFVADVFPAVEYGSVRARVARVATEAKSGMVRVEAEIIHVPRGIALQHGITGRTEVEVEHVAPATLLLRVAGRIVE